MVLMAAPVNKNVIRALVVNPTARRIALRGVKKAATAAFAAAQSSKARQSGAAASGESPQPEPGSRSGSSGRAVASVARPWAEKLAETPAGRSLLQAVSSVTNEALKKAPPAEPAGTIPTAAAKEPAPEEAAVKFAPLTPSPGAESASREEAMKWPPDRTESGD